MSIVLTDDEDDDVPNEKEKAPHWKSVAQRNATPFLPPGESRRSEQVESNKSRSRQRQLFTDSNDSSEHSRPIDEQPDPRELSPDVNVDNGAISVSVQRTKRTLHSRNPFETHSIVTEPSVADPKMSNTYNKDRLSLRNHTYDIVNSVRGSQPNRDGTVTIAPTPENDVPEPSGMPPEPASASNSIDDRENGVGATVEAHGGGNSSSASSAPSSTYNSLPHNKSVGSPHKNHSNVDPILVLHTSVSKTFKSPESTTNDNNRTSNRKPSHRPTSLLSTAQNNRSIACASMTAMSALRESETFSSLLPPANFQDNSIITEHSEAEAEVRETMEQVNEPVCIYV